MDTQLATTAPATAVPMLGNFRLVRRLGRGGMGEVWLGEHFSAGTRVAIKFLSEDLGADDGEVQRFFNEARAVARIRHAGIAKIFDLGRHAGRAYLVMEFLEGESVGQRIARVGKLGLGEALELARQIASVLEATHGAGITHRDLKPENVFVVADDELGERVKVLDFGIAKLSGTLATGSPKTFGAMGTPAYMAPEQWGDAGAVDWRVDLYALGCMLFEMVCGRPPFQPRTVAEACDLHLHATPPRASSVVAAPPALDRLIASLLAKDPAARPRSMREVAAALDAIAVAPARPRTSRAWLALPAVAAAIATYALAARGGDVAETRSPPAAAAPIVEPIEAAPSATPSPSPSPSPSPLPSPSPSPSPQPQPAAIARPPHRGGAPDLSRVHAAADGLAHGRIASSDIAHARVAASDIARDVPPATTPDTTPERAPERAPEGTIDEPAVARALSAHARDLHDCNKDPSASGRIVTSFTINAEGRASALSATGMTDAISGCVLSVIRTIVFPRPVGGTVDVHYPVSFEGVRRDGDDLRALAAAQPALDACAARANVHGHVAATIGADPEGHVTSLALDRDLDKTPFARCAHDAIAHVHFAASHNMDSSLAVPLEFR
jgi:serine/threonine protein kinase